MEYKLVPVNSVLPEKTITIPSELIPKDEEKVLNNSAKLISNAERSSEMLVNYLKKKKCVKTKSGKLKIDQNVVRNSNFDNIVLYLSTGKSGKPPPGVKRLLNTVKLPKKWVS